MEFHTVSNCRPLASFMVLTITLMWKFCSSSLPVSSDTSHDCRTIPINSMVGTDGHEQ